MSGASDGNDPSNSSSIDPGITMETNANLDAIYNVNIENQYDSLSDIDEEIPFAERRPQIKSKRRKHSTEPTTTAKVSTVKFLPPIRVYNTNIKVLSAALSNKLSHFFEFKFANKNMVNLFTTNLADYKNAIKILDEIKESQPNANYYSHTPAEEKPVYFMLRKISPTFDANDITEAMKLIRFKNDATRFIKASKFSTATSTSHLFLIQFAPSSKVQDIVSITHLLHQKVQWDVFIKKEMAQCYRCQRFGHVSSNCGMQPRCVKCLENHEKGKCLLLPTELRSPPISMNTDDNEIVSEKELQNNSQQPACVNCRQRGHPANWRGCPAYLVLKQRREDRIQLILENQKKREELKQSMFNNFTSENVSFSDRLKLCDSQKSEFPKLPIPSTISRNPSRQKNYQFQPPIQSSIPLEPEVIISSPKENNAFSFIQDECKKMFGTDFSTLIKKIKEFLPAYKMIKAVEDKQISLFSFVMSVVENP